MVTTTIDRRSEEIAVHGTVPSWRLGAEGAEEGELAPLGVPAVVLSGLLVLGGAAALPWLPALAADYGGWVPVASIVAVYLTLSVALGSWGLGQRRRS
ncbi:hypothetical protein [Nocardia asteroides]|uniref:Uncharacterized protein n=1 Tax=Nocardia asteroides NBRC 15531 TaxID=1110697 RepID=U5EHR5_NOCAS|nr:hypothetical protein [Nocardia asteroides]UGT51220.1 hypothetical protein LT345_12070 [Nocardia asteroides]GAD85936.1 hypothetical protein NCAST_32_04210 [Nocardia asteroides NBRC 15531]SFM31959.1 hypothetical protein SAMN05444423_102682 [Nocardia asteroides]VEG35898.1 Uncharacterised protein [Nocardia asteroides]